MNKFIPVIILLLIFTTSCTRKNEKPEDIFAQREVIEIRERMFMGQVKDIYMNADDYMEKIIKLEGVFIVEEWHGRTYRFVGRNGPGGCCCNDAMIGFEVVWSGDKEYPEHNSWVEAAGVLKAEGRNPHLELISLTVLKRRGTEYVNQ
jgi:uncharacterized membrane protein YcgQ (UPF0703/DUF1980 family)